jgi:hypothetical protein
MQYGRPYERVTILEARDEEIGDSFIPHGA